MLSFATLRRIPYLFHTTKYLTEGTPGATWLDLTTETTEVNLPFFTFLASLNPRPCRKRPASAAWVRSDTRQRSSRERTSASPLRSPASVRSTGPRSRGRSRCLGVLVFFFSEVQKARGWFFCFLSPPHFLLVSLPSCTSKSSLASKTLDQTLRSCKLCQTSKPSGSKRLACQTAAYLWNLKPPPVTENGADRETPRHAAQGLGGAVGHAVLMRHLLHVLRRLGSEAVPKRCGSRETWRATSVRGGGGVAWWMLTGDNLLKMGHG